jgi:phosphoribosylamine--glycine ligase
MLGVGGGGREHALAWKLRQSPRVREVFCAPGNAGMGAVATCVPIGRDLRGLLAFTGACDQARSSVPAPLSPASSTVREHGLRPGEPRRARN